MERGRKRGFQTVQTEKAGSKHVRKLQEDGVKNVHVQASCRPGVKGNRAGICRLSVPAHDLILLAHSRSFQQQGERHAAVHAASPHRHISELLECKLVVIIVLRAAAHGDRRGGQSARERGEKFRWLLVCGTPQNAGVEATVLHANTRLELGEEQGSPPQLNAHNRRSART